jgi:CTP:molybdopterin cytidylyltransferase MocA
MPVRGSAGTPGLSLKDHEALSRALLLARARLAQVRATVHGDGAWSWSRPILASLAAAIRAVDESRDRLSAALAAEHPVVHPALARRIYFPVVDVDGREEDVDVTPRSKS